MGLKSDNKEKKSMFNPTAKGISPNIVVIAVRRTGFSLALPAFFTKSRAEFLSINWSFERFKSIFFF